MVLNVQAAADERSQLPDQRSQLLIGLAALARIAFSGADLAPVGARLLERAANDTQDAAALLDMSTVLHLRGNREVALELQAQALALRQVYRLGAGGGPRVLVVLSPGDLAENNVLEFLLEDSDIRLEMLYLAPGAPLPAELPAHDLVFVAVCESDRNRPLLAHIEKLFAAWPRPVLNPPGRIARLSRDGACRLLGELPGVLLPPTVRVERAALAGIASGEPLTVFLDHGAFPVIVRPVDSHKGDGLMKIEDPAAMLAYVASRAERSFYLSRYVDYSSADGLYRKYRIVLIKGRPYICHMAISGHWMVHYMSAGMSESAVKRAEEAHCMENFDAVFAARHRRAFRAIAERLELDYVGIDCGELPDGRLMLFEVDSGMTVHSMDGVEMFPYKQVQMARVFRAFREMLAEAAG